MNINDTEETSSVTKTIETIPKECDLIEDERLIFMELKEAENTLTNLQNILKEFYRTENENNDHPVTEVKDKEYISSKQWLKKYGLRAQKLGLYDAFSDCAFRHSDGVVDIKTKPEDESVQTDAETKMKVINAKYCERFVHAHWKDGSVVHVYITKEKYRWYEEKIKTALERLERRIKWLQQGSRELFGTVLEDQVYILIDTSHSMKDKLTIVKEKLFQLMQEQLRHKRMFNLVKFDSRVEAWKEKLTDVNEENLTDARTWAKELQVGSSTNTLRALQIALADRRTQAVYLLTDGRPDQPAEMIFTQVSSQKSVPIHTISFNCNDLEANSFLYKLSSDTGGRFHCYNNSLQDLEAPQPFVSEDIQLLLNEIEKGKAILEKIQKVHTECLMLDWYHNGDKDLGLMPSQKQIQKPITRTGSAHEPQRHSPYLNRRSLSAPRLLKRKKALHAEQTKTSLLRAMSQGVMLCESAPEIQMPPETRELFLRNERKAAAVLKELNIIDFSTSEKRVKKPPKSGLDMSSSRWLKTHGLVARRLTIMDALAPTAVPHTAKYVPILDKHVLARVFDEVLPLAHVSGNRNLITLINPQAVDLDKYKQMLVQAINSYERRLNLVVWRALSQEERDKFDSDKPISYMENKESLLQALDRLGWTISAEDVMLLENEISSGKTYFQQATDLQETAGNKELRAHIKPEKTKEDIKKQDPKEKLRRKRLDTLRGQKVIARSEVDGFYYEGTVIKSLNSKRVLVDFCQGENQIVPVTFIIQTGGALPCPPLKVGDFVFAKTGAENSYFVPAVIIATPRAESEDKIYSVLKHNGRKAHCIRSELYKISQSQFTFSCRYIREAQMVDYTIPNIQFVQPLTHPKEKKKQKGHHNQSQENLVIAERSKTSSFKDQPDAEKSRKNNSFSDGDIRKQGSSSPIIDKLFSEPEQFPKIGWSEHPKTSTPRSEHPKIFTPGSKHPKTSTSSSEHPKTSTPTFPCASSGADLFALDTDINTKLESLASQISQYQKEHTKQQQTIQEYLKDLSVLHSKQNKYFSEEDQKELVTQQIDLLQQLKMLTPISHVQPEKADLHSLLLTKPQSFRCILIPGQKVLAFCTHNGYYEEASIIHDCGDFTYFVQKSSGEIARVCREDMFNDSDDYTKEIKKDDPVIGPHPLLNGYYGPGVVLKIMPDLKLEIKYYDDTEDLVPREHVYLTSTERFDRDTAYILKCEERWVGQPVVTRNDETGTFHLAEVQEHVSNGKQYVICRSDGRTMTQDIMWIFGKYSQPHLLKVGDYVLTLSSPAPLTFLPGVITGQNGTKLHIEFCDGKSCQNVESHHCFGLSVKKYNMAVQYYNQQKQRREEDGIVSDSEDSLSDISSVTLTSLDSESYS
ncbi:von Willebrand factor A domain-containing protein 3B [Bombina bombina]|uniref:von Willebrand factor A domain-containing protein 3B n=1 Tax=Bombina bombina TaxID=8345 RepID=UPI00235ABAAC|nr:von Willebrand factor A domain-containing protein 3B [Bombina bombina]